MFLNVRSWVTTQSAVRLILTSQVRLYGAVETPANWRELNVRGVRAARHWGCGPASVTSSSGAYRLRSLFFLRLKSGLDVTATKRILCYLRSQQWAGLVSDQRSNGRIHDRVLLSVFN